MGWWVGGPEYATPRRYTRRRRESAIPRPGRPAGPVTHSGGMHRVRALLSVADRDGISTFARELIELGVEIYATDGTREHLAQDAIEVGSVADLTDVPPLLGGQVKTFHPAIYAGILARRDKPAQLDELAAHDIGLIDLVVVNIKPFAVEIGSRMVAIDEAIEMIDVGGAALLGAGTLLLLAAGAPGEHAGWGAVWTYPLAGLACVGILYGILGVRLRSPLFEYLGKISFGLYVFHAAALRIVEFPPAALLLTIAMAALSYRFVETPFLRWKERLARVGSRPV